MICQTVEPPWRNGRRARFATEYLGRFGGSSPPGGTIGSHFRGRNPVARTKADMQRLIDQRDALLREIEAIRNKVAGIEMAITLLDGEAPSGSARSHPSVKTILLDLLKEVGTSGLSAASAVQMANRRGITLHAGSVGSTLSRLKAMGVVVLQGNKYVLADYASKDDERPTAKVVLWPSSGTPT